MKVSRNEKQSRNTLGKSDTNNGQMTQLLRGVEPRGQDPDFGARQGSRGPAESHIHHEIRYGMGYDTSERNCNYYVVCPNGIEQINKGCPYMHRNYSSPQLCLPGRLAASL